MPATKVVATTLVVLLAAGGVAATGGAPLAATDTTAPANATASDVEADATYANGTVTVTVTDDGAPLQNVSVELDEREGVTGENGTVALEVTLDDEVEVELDGDGFEGELEYRVQNGSLTLVEESYEYDADDADDAEADEEAADDADDSDADDADES